MEFNNQSIRKSDISVLMQSKFEPQDFSFEKHSKAPEWIATKS
jgi:hypothetical protein